MGGCQQQMSTGYQGEKARRVLGAGELYGQMAARDEATGRVRRQNVHDV